MELSDIRRLLGKHHDSGMIRYWRDPQPDGSNRYFQELNADGHSLCLEDMREATKSDEAIEISMTEYYTAMMNGGNQ
jgi:hypothetical protein